MMISDFPGLSTLSSDDKILLAAELFSEAVSECGQLEIDPKLLRAIEERLEHFEKHPESGLSWEEVKSKLIRNG